MKMKLVDRILLALYALVGIAGILFVVCELYGANWFGHGTGGMLIAVGIGLVLIAMSVRVFIIAFRRGERVDKGSVSVQNTENGAVRVSVAAMDTLVKQAIGQAEGVLDIKTHIVNHEDSITVKIDMTLASDAHIPNVTMLMQRNIKRFIEEFSGIAVREVVIMVSEIRALPAPTTTPVRPVEPDVVVEPEAESEAANERDGAETETARAEVKAEAEPIYQSEPEAEDEPAREAEDAAEEAEPVYESEPAEDEAELADENEIELELEPDEELEAEETEKGKREAADGADEV